MFNHYYHLTDKHEKNGNDHGSIVSENKPIKSNKDPNTYNFVH